MIKVDRSVITTVALDHPDKEDVLFWRSKPPIERFIALEILRQQYFRYDPLSERLQRVLDVVE